MSYQFLKLNIQSNGAATVTLNRPEIHNAFNQQLIQELTQVFVECQKNSAVRVVVLTGEGKSFCAGADLNWMSSMVNYTEEENFNDSKQLARMFQTINDFSKPLIGKINGHALGGGVGLVGVCDYVLAKKGARFGFTEARLGLIPAVISPYCIAKIGESHARAWFLSGEQFSTEQALQMGLIHEHCEEAQLQERTEQLVKSFLSAAPEAAGLAKDLIKNVLTLPVQQVQDHTCRAISQRRVSAEGQEGMKALLEKRKPKWMDL